jgi:hypothetical protein
MKGEGSYEARHPESDSGLSAECGIITWRATGLLKFLDSEEGDHDQE